MEEFGIELLTILAGTWINFPMPVELQTVKELAVFCRLAAGLSSFGSSVFFCHHGIVGLGRLYRNLPALDLCMATGSQAKSGPGEQIGSLRDAAITLEYSAADSGP